MLLSFSHLPSLRSSKDLGVLCGQIGPIPCTGRPWSYAHGTCGSTAFAKVRKQKDFQLPQTSRATQRTRTLRT